jgi:hypothetical protein
LAPTRAKAPKLRRVTDASSAGWPGRVAVAIVRSDPPEVLLASNADVLSRLVALRVVATTDPKAIDAATLATIRAALLDERWGDAVAAWIVAAAEPIDAYPDEEVWTETRLDADAASLEIRLERIFDDGD